MLAVMRATSFAFLLAACDGDIVHTPDDSGDPPVEGLAITALDPAQGPEAGGTLVRVTGQSFTTASAVTVGGAGCDSLTFLSSTELLCLTPAGSEGETALTVTDPAGSASATFTYLSTVDDTAPPDTGEPPATVTSCVVVSPESMSIEAYDYTDDVTASVIVAGRTDGDGEGPGIDAQLGFGDVGSDPSTWTWAEMYYSSSDGDADVYVDSFYVDDVGNYDVAARFRVDHGDWTTCTTASGSYTKLEVVPAEIEVPVDYCHVQWPCGTYTEAGTESEAIYAWIYQYGVTQGEGAGEGIYMDVGIGDLGTDPESNLSWNWTVMAYNVDTDGLTEGDMANDEYMGNFTAPLTKGDYHYVVRATADWGLSYTICDLGGEACNFGGSDDGYDDPGTCTVY